MLKDIILKRLKEINPKQNADYFPIELKGSVEIKAWDKGKLFYHDGGDNTVTVWARHSLINALTGYVHSPIGNVKWGGAYTKYTQPAITTDNHTADVSNKDGNILSNEQYFWDWNGWANNFDSVFQPTIGSGEVADYPYYPTKVLFGTGKEFESYTDMAAATGFADYYNTNGEYPIAGGEYEGGMGHYDIEDYFDGVLTRQPGTQTGIDGQTNYYSNTIDPVTKTLLKTRTVNDITNLPLPDMDYEYSYGIDGAIKDCYVETVATPFLPLTPGVTIANINTIVFDNTTDTINPLFKGLGRPAFIRCRRDGSPKSTSSEICVSTDMTPADEMFENRVTYTAILPEQSAVVGNPRFYPYNGMLLKQIGLFNDANFTLGDIIPGNIAANGFKPYNCMPGGIMMAKRNITPIYKTADVRVSVAWTLYTA